jgi:hypothetical protein
MNNRQVWAFFYLPVSAGIFLLPNKSRGGFQPIICSFLSNLALLYILWTTLEWSRTRGAGSDAISVILRFLELLNFCIRHRSAIFYIQYFPGLLEYQAQASKHIGNVVVSV